WVLLLAQALASPALSASPDPALGTPFWSHWGDGLAEVNAYDLVVQRYGETREGIAVTIFVTETMLYSQRVKAETSTCCTQDQLPVMKLNALYDFPTGLYDYNLMTSSWIALGQYRHYQPGDPIKVTFSAQE